jgi:cell shape-determining protein MreC
MARVFFNGLKARMIRSRPSRFSAWPLIVIGVIGAGLIALPEPHADVFRSLVRDGAAPGERALLVLRDRWQSLRDAGSAGDTARSVHLAEELQLWRRRALQLQAQSARFQQQLAEARRGALPPFETSPVEPLVIPELVETRVLGRERAALELLAGRLVDCGGLQGVAIDDLVLDADQTHLDAGSASDVTPDLPVCSGRRVVGRIKHAGRWTSTVQWLTDPGFRGHARLIRGSAQGPVYGAEGVLTGAGDGACRLELIAATDPVSIGDYVYTVAPPASSSDPFCYGRVAAAELAPGASHWTITVAPAIGDEPFETLQVLRELPNPARWSPRDEARRSEEASVSGSIARTADQRSGPHP